MTPACRSKSIIVNLPLTDHGRRDLPQRGPEGNLSPSSRKLAHAHPQLIRVLAPEAPLDQTRSKIHTAPFFFVCVPFDFPR